MAHAHDPAHPLADVGTSFYPESAPETPYSLTLGLDTGAFPSGVASPDPLLTPSANNEYFPLDRKALAQALGRRDSGEHLSIRMQTHDIADRSHHQPSYSSSDHGDEDDDGVLPDLMLELSAIRSRTRSAVARVPEDVESGSSTPVRAKGSSQGVPPELANLAAEVIFVLVCTAGQFIFALTYGHANVAQLQLRTALGLPATQIPWVLGSGLLASGLSVIVAGSLADLAAPKPLMVGAFVWSAVWHAVAAVALSPRLKVLFFVSRAMQGLSQGVLVSASMSILGRVYKPGVRKTRVFSLSTLPPKNARLLAVVWVRMIANLGNDSGGWCTFWFFDRLSPRWRLS